MNIHNLNHRIYNSRKQLTNLKLERSNWWDDKDMVAYYDEKISDLLEVISNLSKQKEELLSLKGKTFTNKLFKTITKNLEDMQTIATINEVFAKRKRDEQRILNGAKTLGENNYVLSEQCVSLRDIFIHGGFLELKETKNYG